MFHDFSMLIIYQAGFLLDFATIYSIFHTRRFTRQVAGSKKNCGLKSAPSQYLSSCYFCWVYHMCHGQNMPHRLWPSMPFLKSAHHGFIVTYIYIYIYTHVDYIFLSSYKTILDYFGIYNTYPLVN